MDRGERTHANLSWLLLVGPALDLVDHDSSKRAFDYLAFD